jgi:hypothetical protein
LPLRTVYNLGIIKSKRLINFLVSVGVNPAEGYGSVLHRSDYGSLPRGEKFLVKHLEK